MAIHSTRSLNMSIFREIFDRSGYPRQSRYFESNQMTYEACLATILQSTAALFALAAAYSWFRVGRIKTPSDIEFLEFGEGGLSGPLAEVVKGVAQQGIWNYRGAICAGVAAVFQTLSIVAEQLP